MEIEARVETSTQKAWLIEPTMGNKKQIWLPKSQVVRYDVLEEGLMLFEVTEWWYKKAGLNKEPDNE